MSFEEVVDIISKVVDGAGIGVLVLGILVSSGYYLRNILFNKSRDADPYRQYRKSVGRSILLGLEFLIAGDIIRTVAV